MGGETFLVGLRGAKLFSIAFQIVSRILFRVFQTVFRIDLKFFGGKFVLHACRPNQFFLNDGMKHASLFSRGIVGNPPAFLVAHDCGYPLSRYTCRATRVAADFLDFIAFCRCSTGVALHPLKILVSHLPPPVPGGVAPKFGCLKRCRATRGCRSSSCGCRATLCN